MAETKKCSFTGKQIPPGTGRMYVKKTGQVLYFINSKAKKNYVDLNRIPARTRWTDTFHSKRKNE
jgi:large subunit ribosomal protein L24e